MKTFGIICASILSIVIGIVLGGVLVMKFWEWFINPVFYIGLLSLGQAVGISSFITLFKTVSFDKKSDVGTMTVMISSVVYQSLLLGLGWIISLFI